MDHDFIIKTILDNNGYIHGGYVRSWVENGEPCDKGWEDIDCVFTQIADYSKTKQQFSERFGTEAPLIDIRFPANMPFDDFFCNCWMFDGKIKPKEMMPISTDLQKLKEETESKIARCIVGFQRVMLFPWRVRKMLKNGWDIVDSRGTNILDAGYKYVISQPLASHNQHC